MQRYLIAFLPLLLAACAAPPSTELTSTANEPGVICQNETRTGTNLRTQHCRSAEQREKDMQTGKETLSEANRPVLPVNR